MRIETWNFNTESKTRLFLFKIASGLGFGMISGAFSLVNVLGDMSGPGTLGIKGDSQAFYLVSCKSNTFGEFDMKHTSELES